MILDRYTAKKTVELLLKIKAIKLSLNDSFVWASGWKSPIYCDNRITLSYPIVRIFLKEALTKLIEKEYGKPDVIAGVATGGIAMGVLVAQELGIPFIYVRSEIKKHGRKTQIEGHLESGQNIVVFEDLISTGKSSLETVEILKKANATVKGIVAIFSYGFDITHKNLEDKNVSMATLSNYEHLLEEISESNYVNDKELTILKNWNTNPSEWKKMSNK